MAPAFHRQQSRGGHIGVVIDEIIAETAAFIRRSGQRHAYGRGACPAPNGLGGRIDAGTYGRIRGVPGGFEPHCLKD